MSRSLLIGLLLVTTLVTAPQAAAATWVPKTPPLTTPWTSQVSPTNALPDYPRPQMVRADWLNLNGVWEFRGAPNLNTPPIGQTLPEGVLVPYPIESALSGIMRHEDNMFYRRTFTVPSTWDGRRVRLNFGAVTPGTFCPAKYARKTSRARTFALIVHVALFTTSTPIAT